VVPPLSLYVLLTLTGAASPAVRSHIPASPRVKLPCPVPLFFTLPILVDLSL